MRMRAGFTLVEVLTTALITTLIGGALLTVAIAGHRVSDLTNARLTAMTNAQQAMNVITTQLRQTSNPAVGPVRCHPSGLALIFSPTQGNTNFITYSISANELQRRQTGATPLRTVVASGVYGFQVSCPQYCAPSSNDSPGQGPQASMVQILVVAMANSWQGWITQTLESQAQIPNPCPS